MFHRQPVVDGILRVEINRADYPVNAFSLAVLDELAELLTDIEQDVEVRAVSFRTTKPGTFIAGADVQEIQQFTTIEEAKSLSEKGQKIFGDLEKLSATKPTVAMIHGACLGGGLEFAMACGFRIASDDAKTLLGLPEVHLGLIPGWGGTVRMPRLLGLIPSLPLILAGTKLNGFQARSRGLVNDVVPAEAFDNVEQKILRHVIANGAESGGELFRKRKRSWFGWVKKTKLVRKIALNKAEKQTKAKTRGHYPAPQKAIDVLRAGLEGEDAGFAAEASGIAELSQTSEAKELIRVFFLQQRYQKPPKWLPETRSPKSISHAGVLGAGAMGAGIALMFARKGVHTRLKDISPQALSKGMGYIGKAIAKDQKRRRLSKLQARDALDCISPTTDYSGFRHADLVVEAILEDLELKQRVFDELATNAAETTVFATNTSSLLVADLAESTPHPERVVGLHFFNPAEKMPLVEVVRGPQTSDAALATAVAVAQRLGKTIVVTGDCAGFLVNRLLVPYMNEAGYLLEEVNDPMEIDRAAVEFGMPMGPLELVDLVGHDVAAHVAENVYEAYGERMQPAPFWKFLAALKDQPPAKQKIVSKKRRFNPVLKKAIRAQRRPADSLNRGEIIERLILPMINEGARCIEEEIVKTPDDIDVGMIFGTGFAPFRGGPMRYAETLGYQNVVDTLDQVAGGLPRLVVSDALRNLAAKMAPAEQPASRELATAEESHG